MELNSNIVAIVQARMGSTRFPGKILKTIQKKPMLWHIVNRLNRVDEINEVVIATSDSTLDDAVFEMTEKYDISCFRGSESDVLSRFYNTAIKFRADHIIRITGDCPLIDPPTIRKLIKLYFDESYDYCNVACGASVAKESNIKRFPDGLDAEIFSFKVLKEAFNEAETNLQREHVTPFIWKNKERYKLDFLLPDSGDYLYLRWTIDKEEDFEFVKWIYDKLYPNNNKFNMNDILKLLDKYPNVASNKHLIGQEGYGAF